MSDVETPISLEELRLAARNHAMPLEALRHPITPAGLHYLLIHYDIPDVDEAEYTLEVDGLVASPLALSLAELRARPAVELAVTMECAGNGRILIEPHVFSQPWLHEAVGTARWRGTPLRGLLAEAGVADQAVELVFSGLDHGLEGGIEQAYQRSLSRMDAHRPEVLLAYEMNGAPLLPQHGFPLRLLVPGWYGMTSVKWLTRITAVDRPFEGYQQSHSYRLRQEEDETGEPLSRMLPRSLMAPPGFPEFPTRRRFISPGPCLLEGRAWSGLGELEVVDVSTDGGDSWATAEIEDDVGSPWAWRRWTFEWNATEGEHELCCRARDAAGNEQPLEPSWNLGGYANNAVQRIRVTVTST
jgi:DMSO/TMAO reductase YedYZ molybdopterin-dependent catalytic subunit